MDALIDPNVAYLLLVIGMMLSLMALTSPGTGLYEAGAIFMLVLAGYSAYYQQINYWALIPMGLALIPFVGALRVKRWRAALLAVSILLMILGSVFLFQGPQNSLMGVNPILAILVSAAFGGIVWLAVERTMAVMEKPAVLNPQNLIGKIGDARTAIKEEGSVQISGELWSARSKNLIQAGSAVRVVAMDGFVLIVENAS